MAGDEGFEPPILGPEPSALPLGQSPMTVLLYPKRGVRIIKYEGFRVTFRDPATSTMKTSFQVMIALQIATGNSHPDPGTRTQCLGTFRAPELFLLATSDKSEKLPCDPLLAVFTLGQSPIIMISMESGKVCLGKLRLPTECSYCKQVYNLNSSLATRY